MQQALNMRLRLKIRKSTILSYLKYIVVGLIWSLIFNINLSFAAPSEKGPILVFRHGAEAAISFLDSLKDALSEKISDRKIEIINTNKRTIAELKTKVNANQNCLVTIGKESTEKLLATRIDSPIYTTLVAKTTLDSLSKVYSRLGIEISGIYLEQSFKRQLLLGKAINNQFNNAAVLLGRNTRYSLKAFQKDVDQLSLTLFYNILKHHESPQQYFSRLKLKDGFLILLNDSEFVTNQNIQSLLLTSYQKQIPMIGSKKSDTVYGALVSIYTPEHLLAKEVAEDIQQICNKSPIPKPKFSKHYAISINHQIAEHLHFNSLEENSVLERVHELDEQSTKLK